MKSLLFALALSVMGVSAATAQSVQIGPGGVTVETQRPGYGDRRYEGDRRYYGDQLPRRGYGRYERRYECCSHIVSPSVILYGRPYDPRDRAPRARAAVS